MVLLLKLLKMFLPGFCDGGISIALDWYKGSTVEPWSKWMEFGVKGRSLGLIQEAWAKREELGLNDKSQNLG